MNTPVAVLNVTGIAFAMHKVTDVPRARRFYEDTLGLQKCAEMEFAPGQWWIEYDTGPSALAITNFQAPDTKFVPTASVALEITNYDDVLPAIKAAGIPITWGPNEFPVCRCFGFKDPDGNELYLHERAKQG
jgi:predicted enzyme related to lactoylglutathione lyase